MKALRTEDGAGIIEYSLVVVLIGLVAITGIGFVGRETSDTFEQTADAFPTEPTPAVDPVETEFGELVTLVEGLEPPIKSLVSKAEKAQSRYLNDNSNGALRKLDSITKQVDRLEARNRLTSAQANQIRTTVQELVDAVENP